MASDESSPAKSPAVEPLPGEQSDQLQYRSISTLAVVALLLGLLSASALAAPLLLIVPLAACCVAVAALAAIARSPERLAGARLAQTGLLLAIILGVAAVVRIEVRTTLLNRQAAAAVDAWVDLLTSEQWDAAIERLSGRGKGTLQPPSSPAEAPPPLAEVQAFMKEELANTPLVERLAQLEPPLEIHPLKPLRPPIFLGRTVTLQNLYEVRSSATEAGALRMTVQLTRSPAFEADGLSLRIDDWAVEPIDDP